MATDDVEKITFELVPSDETRLTIPVPHMGRSELSVGRGDRCIVRFTESYVSRNHARLVLEAGRLFLVPLSRDEALVSVDGVGTRKDQRVELRDGASLNFVKDAPEFAYTVRKKVPAPPPAEDAEMSEARASVDGGKAKSDAPMSSAKKRKAASTSSAWEEDYECVICSGVIAYCHCLPCGHTACGECLSNWLRTKRQCPECRADVPPSAVLAPVHMVDRIVEAKIAKASAGERADWAARAERWRSTRGIGPLLAPPDPAARPPAVRPRPPPASRPPRAPGAAPPRSRQRRNAVSDIRAHFPPAAAPPPPVVDLAGDDVIEIE